MARACNLSTCEAEAGGWWVSLAWATWSQSDPVSGKWREKRMSFIWNLQYFLLTNLILLRILKVKNTWTWSYIKYYNKYVMSHVVELYFIVTVGFSTFWWYRSLIFFSNNKCNIWPGENWEVLLRINKLKVITISETWLLLLKIQVAQI